MNITVGLDFGTHQTKICVEDSSDSQNKIYRFITFNDSNGKETIFLPSVVQINEDDTVSYGFVDECRCKVIERANTLRPNYNDYVDASTVLPSTPPTKPTSQYPRKPEFKYIAPKPEPKVKPKSPSKARPKGMPRADWKIEYDELERQYHRDLKRYNSPFPNEFDNKERIAQEREYKLKMAIWESQRKEIDRAITEYNTYQETKKQLDQQVAKYNSDLMQWERRNESQKQHFRYFKYPALTAITDSWYHEISFDYISVWYLAHIIFMLNEIYGSGYVVQMGLPTTYSESGIFRKRAYRLLLAAFDLTENKYESREEFYAASYQELLETTDLNISIDDDIVTAYGIAAIPEAYASLRAVTSRNKLSGMQFLVDIGGGTTDIAFFTVKDSMPDIHKIESMPKGLNFILEQYSAENAIGIEQAQAKFATSDDGFDDYIATYKSSLREYINSLIGQITNEYHKTNPNHIKSLYKAFEGKNIIYCGGGGVNHSLYVGFDPYFNDLQLLDANMLDVDAIINNLNDELYPILSTAYGLSIGLDGRDKDEIKLTPFSKTFDKAKIHTAEVAPERNDDM